MADERGGAGTGVVVGKVEEEKGGGPLEGSAAARLPRGRGLEGREPACCTFLLGFMSLCTACIARTHMHGTLVLYQLPCLF